MIYFSFSSSAGAIFTADSNDLQSALKYAIQLHNSNPSSKFKAEGIIEVVDTDDPFTVTNARRY